ncbi:MAG: TraR/DksA family transcriptional regulator [Candidatus Rokubacteria bacterium]|nr:TraR/DksA family transcriptional regulator [Candidatus Rokubacteria bacterium]
MKTVKDELETKRRSLELAISNGLGQSRNQTERNEMTKDPYGSASMTHDDEMIVDVVGRRMRELQNVNRALADLEAGRYGTCEDCGEEISAKRLKALPFAMRCIACQSSMEGVRRAA